MENLPLYLQIHTFLVFGAGSFYFFNFLQLYLDYRLTKDHQLINTIFLSLSMGAYCFLIVGSCLIRGLIASNVIMHLEWIMGILSGFYYVRSLRIFLNVSNKYLLIAEKIVPWMAVAVTLALVIYLSKGPQLLYRENPDMTISATDYYGIRFYTPTVFMNIFALSAATFFIFGTGINFRAAWSKRPKERWLMAGMTLTTFTLVIDILSSLSLVPSFSLLFLSKGFELVRISRHYHKKAMARVTELESQLSQMSKEAAMSFVTSGLAHDVNNPLSILLLNVRSLKKDSAELRLTDSALRKIDSLEKNTMRIQDMMESYLGLLKQNHQVEKTAVSVQQVIENAMELCAPRIARAKVQKIEIVHGANKNIYVQKTQFELIVANLINNAIDATMEQTNPWIKIVTSWQSDHISINIWNSGALPPEVQEHLFKDGFSTKGDSGHGIGLRISESLAKANQAKLVLDPQMPGVCFCLTVAVA